jgi:hypothetical protein
MMILSLLKVAIQRENELIIDLAKFSKAYPSLSYALNTYGIYENKSTLYVVTPTYKRDTQMADLVALRNTLVLVPKLVWILIEDSENRTERIGSLLRMSHLHYVHLSIPTPKLIDGKPFSRRNGRGIFQRNAALDWFRQHRDHDTDIRNGVLYFADDDNRYDVRIFDDMRTTKTVSVWPVGLCAQLKYEGPICKDNKVIKWLTVFHRRFNVDMAGLAINLAHLFQFPNLKFGAAIGYLESKFIEDLNCTIDTLETKAEDCKQVQIS